jgi:hypothetical protein
MILCMADRPVKNKMNDIQKSTTSDAKIRSREYIWRAQIYKSEQFEMNRAITAYDGDIVKSDNTIPLSLQEAFKTAVISKPWENET